MTPLVLVHGFMGGSAQWALQAPLEQDRPLVRIDLPGFGANAHLDPINRIDGFAAWVLDTLRADGVEEFDLLGHSMGGMIVQEMTHQAPDRVQKLILYGTGSVGVLPGRFETIETSMARAKADGAKATAQRLAATWFLDMEKHPEYPACAAIAENAQLPALIAGFEAMQTWSGVERLASIQSETLILWGEADRAYPWSQVEKLWQTIPKTHLAVVPFCSHAVHAERPDVFNATVEVFLRGDA
ncbi:MAG: alpha/beta hydrolase [Pseudomonadota bacterium]